MSLILLSLLYNFELYYTSVDYLGGDTEMEISISLPPAQGFKGVTCTAIRYRLTGHKLVSLSEFVWEFESLWYSKQEGLTTGR